MSKRIYLVHEIDKRVRRASEHFQPTAIGGGALLATPQHHIDGAEHLAASDITTLNATALAHGLMPKLSGVAGDVLHGDGTWGAGGSSGGGGGSGVEWRVPPWVKRPGSGQMTLAPEDRVTVDSGSGYKSFMDMVMVRGRLHLVYRQGTDHQSTLDGVVKYRTSDNNGLTWTAATTIYDPAGSFDCRDPYIVALSSGRLLVSVTVAPATVANRKVYTFWSDDGGTTWTAPVEFTDHGYDNSPAVGHMLEISDGSVLMFLFGKIGSGDSRYSANVVQSMDAGETWAYLATIATAPSTDSYEEPNARFVASGAIVSLIRNGTDGHTYRSVSTDEGETWSAVTDAHTMAGRPDFVEFYPNALLQIGRDTPANQYARYSTSWDGGENWTSLAEVDVGSTKKQMYAAPVMLGPGYVVAVYAEEQSSTDTDLFVRYWYAGYGVDALGQARYVWVEMNEQDDPDTPPTGKGIWYVDNFGHPSFINDDGDVFDLSSATGSTHWELVVADGITDPPEAVYTDDGTDFVYAEVSE